MFTPLYLHIISGGNRELKTDGVQVFGPAEENIPCMNNALRACDEISFGGAKAEVIDGGGHTLGHIAYYFPNEKTAFVGDSIFSLGCGRMFEGTPEVFWQSLSKIKQLPDNTTIYCGHEYTLQNSNFCIANDSKNSKLKDKVIKIKEKIDKGLPTIPTILNDEIECNIFLKAKDVKTFSKLRDLKDNF